MARSDVRRLVKIVLVVLAGALALSGCATHAKSAAGRTVNEWASSSETYEGVEATSSTSMP